MNSGTTVVPTFYHGRSRSQDQGIFYINCRLEAIPATGMVVQANFPLPSTETLGREATASTCIVRNLSPLWTRCRQGPHSCQHVAIDAVWIHRVSLRLCWQQTCEIFLIHCECAARLPWNASSRLCRVWDTLTRSVSVNSTSQRPLQLLTQDVVWTPLSGG